MSKDNPTPQEIDETYKWWCQVNGGWDYAVRNAGNSQTVIQVLEYIKVNGPQKPLTLVPNTPFRYHIPSHYTSSCSDLPTAEEAQQIKLMHAMNPHLRFVERAIDEPQEHDPNVITINHYPEKNT